MLKWTPNFFTVQSLLIWSLFEKICGGLHMYGKFYKNKVFLSIWVYSDFYTNWKNAENLMAMPPKTKQKSMSNKKQTFIKPITKWY